MYGPFLRVSHGAQLLSHDGTQRSRPGKMDGLLISIDYHIRYAVNRAKSIEDGPFAAAALDVLDLDFHVCCHFRTLSDEPHSNGNLCDLLGVSTRLAN